MTRGLSFAVAVSLIALGTALAPNTAGATNLTGDTIMATFDYPTQGKKAFFPGSFSVNPFIVNGTIETVFSNQSSCDSSYNCININFNKSSVVLTFINQPLQFGGTSSQFLGFDFTDKTAADFGTIASVLVPGGQSVTATATPTDLFVNWAGQNFNVDNTITINFTTVGGIGTAPLPPAWTMMLAGLAGLGLIFGRNRTRADFAV